jgi:hypothetical protein
MERLWEGISTINPVSRPLDLFILTRGVLKDVLLDLVRGNARLEADATAEALNYSALFFAYKVGRCSFSGPRYFQGHLAKLHASRVSLELSLTEPS